MKPTDPVHGANAPAPDPRAQVLKLSKQLESVFVNQLFQAMRESVPDESPVGESTGRELFTSMLDEKLSDVAAQHMSHGISEALYRQLCGRLPASPAGPAAAPLPASPAGEEEP